MALAADVVLGLLAKTEQVFAGDEMALGDDTFLSFPVSSVVALAAPHMAELGRPSSSPAAAQAAADFARTVNTIPRGRLWRTGPDPNLWEVLSKVLTEAEVASATPSNAEQAAYDRARRLLYDTRDDGTVVESPALLKYRQHRDAWFVAQAEHANRRGSAELAGGDELTRFREVDEPKLRAAITEIETAWEVDGKRSEIEAAQQTVRTLYARSPATAWGTFLARFDPNTPDLSMFSAPDQSRYAPTGLMPATVAETAWPTISLDRAELDALAESTDAELRRSLGGDSDRTITGVSFDYTSASLERPWFSSDVFDARYWRFPPGVDDLSDGGTPASGTCPAYVTAVALARNVVVHRTVPAADRGGRPPAGKRRDLGFLGGARLQPIEDPASVLAARRVLATTRVQGGPAAGDPAAGTVRDHRTVQVRDHRSPSAAGVVAGPAVGRLKLRDIILASPKVVVTQAEPGGQTPAGEMSAEATPAGEIYVLAFICKWLPRTPDPDPKLFAAPAASNAGTSLAADKAKAALAYNRKQGFTVAEIKLIQRVVGSEPDGAWGLRTVQAVARWQKANGIRVDGRVRRHDKGDTWPPIQAAAKAMT